MVAHRVAIWGGAPGGVIVENSYYHKAIITVDGWTQIKGRALIAPSTQVLQWEQICRRAQVRRRHRILTRVRRTFTFMRVIVNEPNRTF